jgi:UDP-N-acetylmuramyl pentapeptide synthase
MRYSVRRDLPALVRTPLGRAHLRWYGYHRAWPILSRLAYVHRRTLARTARVVGVVGSFGKTTTARAVLTALTGTPQTLVNRNQYSFIADALLRIGPRDRHAVIEVGIERPGQMADYARLLGPDLAVVTSVGSEHNRSLGTLETTRAEKAEMVRVLRPRGLAVLNGDDPNVRWMAGRTQAAIRTFGFGAANDVRATHVSLDWPHGTRFTLHADDDSRDVRVRLVGRPGVYAILAAVTVALAEGFPLDKVLPPLQALTPTAGRLEVVQLPNAVYLLRDDYKAPLETIDAALDVLAEIPAVRRIVVLGEVDEPFGSEGPIYRRLGERVAQIASRAILVGGSKSFQRYAAGATRAGLARDALVHAGRNVLGVVQALQEDLRPGDVVLIKGRDSQRLARVALALLGATVRCELTACHANAICDRCPMLKRGWDGLPAVI